MTKAPAKAAAKKAGNKAAAKAAASADAALDTKPDAAATEAETSTDEPTREVPAMEAAADPTDFDNLLDLCRAVDPKFGSESAKEGTAHFMLRMLTAVGDANTEQFDSLAISQQTWYENAVEQANQKQDITPPDGYTAPEAAPPAAAKKKGAAAKKEAAPKKAREPKAPKEKAPRVASKTMPVRLAVCANPAITLDELVALLPAIGKTTLSTTRSDTLATLEAARNSGWSAPK